jgi:glycosyltransferase involved in cell wall biosynthesis
MDKIFIINDNFYNQINCKIDIGGIYTYIENLSKLFNKHSYEVTILQLSNSTFELLTPNYKIVGFNKKIHTLNSIYKKYWQDYKNSIFIIATDQSNIKSIGKNTITIQHGIAFDKPSYYEKNIFLRNKLISIFYKIFRNVKNIIRYRKSNNLVCVDYNYYNWLKINYSVYDYNNIHFIPNFTKVLYSKENINYKLNNRRKKKIIFARRFVDYRGVIIFSQAVDYLLKKYDIEITFAGEGFYKPYLFEKYKHCNNVIITTYESSNSVNFHYNYDIAIVPTIYSEGTSLSILEAMAAGCFIITTFVGGLSNITIDHFNGLLIKPTKEDLISKIESVINMDDLKFNNIVINGYETIINAFNIDLWEYKWLYLIKSLH